MSGGHVFVIHGNIAHLDCDAVIVPTDRAFTVTGSWAEILGVDRDDDGTCRAEELKPTDWSDRRFDRSLEPRPGATPPRPTWFIDAAWYRQGTDRALREIEARLAETLKEIAATPLEVRHGRPHPLVAVPVLGTGQGGFERVRGAAVASLLDACETGVDHVPLDVVIVAFSRSDYSALQHRRTERAERTERTERADDKPASLDRALYADACRLAAKAKEEALALFLGAGVSIPAGLPSWTDLLDGLGRDAGVDFGDLSSMLDKAELLRRQPGSQLNETVVGAIRDSRRYAITHAMLAALGCSQVVTTNYDDLYEVAAQDVQGESPQVLPFDIDDLRGRWVLKMHGDVRHAEWFVLSRSDVVNYDAKARPLASIVRSLMITKHLLVVGASMTDDNFLRLAHEVLTLYESESAPAIGREEPEIGTVITLTDEPARAHLWRGRFDYIAASHADNVPAQARDLAIFLDAVAMLSSEPSYLLDPRYADLLGESEKAAAEHARQLLAEISGLGSSWDTLARHLHELGAP